MTLRGKHRPRWLACTALTLLVLALQAVPAWAAPVPENDDELPGFADRSTEAWSGYSALGGPYRKIVGAFVVPKPDCSQQPVSRAAIWVGLDGDGNRNVLQSGVRVDCTQTNAEGVRYQAWFQNYPAPPVLLREDAYPVKAGDYVVVQAEVRGDNSAVVKMTEQSVCYFNPEPPADAQCHDNWEATFELPYYGGGLVSAEAIVEPYSRASPLTNFGTVRFLYLVVDDKPLADVGADRITSDFRYDGTVAVCDDTLYFGAFFNCAWQKN